MECVKIMELIVKYTIYTLPIIVIIYVIKKTYNFIFKRDISTARQDNAFSDIKGAREKLKELWHLQKKQLKPKYYFKDDFHKLVPEFTQNILKEFDEFGKYVSFQLRCLQFEPNKEKLKNEIRKIIIRIAEEDSNSLSSDTSANTQTQDNVAKQ